MLNRHYHEPVLMAETLKFLAPQPGETVLDATLGGGGHSAEIAPKIDPGGTLIGMDRDPEAIAEAGDRLIDFEPGIRLLLVHRPFAEMDEALTDLFGPRPCLDGVLFDLGVSSHQLDAARGFSFRRDEALDMRMDPTCGISAGEWLRSAKEEEIARVLWEFGEERFSRRIAAELVRRAQMGEPVVTTSQLAQLVEKAIPRAAWPRDIHPATRTFQAIRLQINGELDQLREGLTVAAKRLKPGGRIVVLSYHSLEDRIVKQEFAALSGRLPSPPGSSPAAFLPNVNDARKTLELLTRKPVVPTEAEIERNPRARSAKLRAALKG